MTDDAIRSRKGPPAHIVSAGEAGFQLGLHLSDELLAIARRGATILLIRRQHMLVDTNLYKMIKRHGIELEKYQA